MTELEMNTNEKPLESWKEIAAYLKRDVRTVRRWEKGEGLPVHRQMHQARGSVFAYPSELEAWKSSRELRLTAPPPITPWRRAATGVSFALTMLLTLVSMASGPILNPTTASAQGIVNRQVWAGPDVDTEGGVTSDGRYLTYTDWETGDLAVRDLAAGESRHLTHNGKWTGEYTNNSVPSPDGKQVAYGWFNGSFWELRVMVIDGSQPRTIYRNEAMAYLEPKAWSPDGKQIFATIEREGRSKEIVTVSVGDGSLRVLKALDAGFKQWPHLGLSPDGRFLAYDLPQKDDYTHRDIFLLSADGGGEAPLIEHPSDDYLLGWAPDGKTVFFASDRTGTIGAWAIEVIDGKPHGSPTLLKPDIGRITPLGFTQKGSFYSAQDNGIVDLYTATVDFASGKLYGPPEPITQFFAGSNAAPDWSPDGLYLAYLSGRHRAQVGIWRQAPNTIIIRSLQTGEERELAPKLRGMHVFSGLRWAPDGHSILVHGVDTSNRVGVFLIDTQSASPSMLVEGPFINMFSLTPDGKSLVYRENGRLLIRDLGTGQVRELARDVWGSRWGLTGMALSPDGRQVAFATQADPEGVSQLKIVPVTGGAPRELYRLKEPNVFPWNVLAWTPNGRSVAFGKGSSNANNLKTEIWEIPVEDGEAKRLDLTMDLIQPFRIHPDGQHAAFVAGIVSSEVWVLENFLPGDRKLLTR